MDNDQPIEVLDPDDFSDPSPNPAKDPDLASVCDILKGHGIKSVAVMYDGSGDSGSIEEVKYLPEGISVPKAVDVKFQEVAEEYCPAGYENNAGGYGTLTVYPFDGLAELEHGERYEDAQAMDTPKAHLPKALKLRLARLGVTEITGSIDGSGDSGQIEDLTVVPDSITLDAPMADKVEEFLLGRLAGGWENNAGGYGDFAIDVATGDVEIDAYWRLEEANETTTSWNWRQPWPTHTIIH